MKGMSMPEDIGMTLILLVVVMVMIVLGMFIYLKFTLGVGDQIEYSIDFVSIQNKPFMIADVLSHVQLGDRQLLEKSIETSAVNSPESANTVDLPVDISSFVKTYGLTQYYISINRDNREIISADSTEQKCGPNQEGWCVFGDCDVGRVEISNNDCISKWAKCCKEDKTEYARTHSEQIVACGPSSVGVCSKGTKPFWKIFSDPSSCAQNRVYIGRPPECAGANGGSTKVCCAAQTEESLITAGIATKAVVPLMYKDRYGTLEVTVK